MATARFHRVFGDTRPVIGMVHLGALPGTPLHDAEAGLEALVEGARADLAALQAAGFDAVMFGNENDRPYEFAVDTASTATMAYVIGRLRSEIAVPFGANVLWDPMSTVALAAATGAAFVREIFTGTYASDMGPWTPDAGAAMRYRDRLGARDVAMLYNVSAEFADSLDRRPLADRARSAVFSSIPDAVLVSGQITGEAAEMTELEAVKAALPDTAVMANTGVKHDTVAEVLRVADGCIVGSSLKLDGDTWKPVDPDRAADFMARAGGAGRVMREILQRDLTELMGIPGLSGHEDRVRRAIRDKLLAHGIAATGDRLGNLIARFEGEGPRVMLFTHMDQLGFVVRKIEADGLIRVERLGGVPERAMASQAVVLCGRDGDVPGIIANKSHHATAPDEKYQVVKAPDLRIDIGHGSKAAVEAAGIAIGTPVVYAPRVLELAGGRIAGTAVDDRAGCTVLLEVARALAARDGGPPVDLVFSVQEEFNLRGAVVAAQALAPDIAIQLDLMLAADTPEMADRGEMRLGGGPGISLYSFHGRGTLNGVLPHPALVTLFEETAAATGQPLQRSAQVGVLTDLSYVQLVGAGVASIDIGFPMRYSHSSLEMVDLADLEALTKLVLAALPRIGPEFPLVRD